MHVGDHQGPDMINGKINGEIRRGSTAALVLALEQAAVYEDAALFGRVTNGEFVAGAGYARGGAVVALRPDAERHGPGGRGWQVPTLSFLFAHVVILLCGAMVSLKIKQRRVRSTLGK